MGGARFSSDGIGWHMVYRIRCSYDRCGLESHDLYFSRKIS